MADLQKRRVEIIAELSYAMRNGWVYEDYAPLQRELRELERRERDGKHADRKAKNRELDRLAYGATDPGKGDWSR
jgi:hypothetical protein